MDNSISDESNSHNERIFDGSTSGSSQPSGTSSGEDDHHSIKNQLTKKGSKALLRTRLSVISLLVAAAAALSAAAFIIVRNADIEEFESQYGGLADKIVASFENIFVEMAAVSGLSVAASAHSVDHESDWPFVTLSNFNQRAGNARAISGTLGVTIAPLVRPDQLDEWEQFTLNQTNNYWMDDSFAAQESDGVNDFTDPEVVARDWLTDDKVDPVHTHDEQYEPIPTQSAGPYLPLWQCDPVLKLNWVNENLFEGVEGPGATKVLETGQAVLGGFLYVPAGTTSGPSIPTAYYATLLSMAAGEEVAHFGDPTSYMHIPIFDSFNPTSKKAVAVMSSIIHWPSHFRGLLSRKSDRITVVLENECDSPYTYELRGSTVVPIGRGDKHDSEFNEYRRDGAITVDNINDGTREGITLNQDSCPYKIRVYPTQYYYDSFSSGDPALITTAVALVFAFTISMFFVYDRLVERRQKLVLAKATQSTAIVSSLFPKQVRDRLLETEQERVKSAAMQAPNSRLKSFINGPADAANNEQEGNRPIADLFPNCTVFFADIAGFTAWSSTREPAQVFILLQTVYQAFDMMAKRRRVFKVETIGDSYVAVTGLPEPQENHATIMVKFAWECLKKVGQITRDLEVSLGPDTGDLGMRFGLHSGPVTAGVLKGDRARFQLFGDTVNTASRMESTGQKGKIQVSQSTADVLTKAGRESWLTPRDDAVKAKGKGVLKTYWIRLAAAQKEECATFSDEEGETSGSRSRRRVSEVFLEKEGRLVDWTVDVLLDQVRKIVKVREALGRNEVYDDNLVYRSPDGTICLDEMKDAIAMPRYDTKVSMAAEEATSVVVPQVVVKELREYVEMTAQAYRTNAFHNFEHACHVTMSATKIMKRIVAPNLSKDDAAALGEGNGEAAEELHKSSNGITSDPLAYFALTFATLIHDVDHQGIPNDALTKEEPDMGTLYRNKSVAEQNSLDVAWDMLMSERFKNLRKYVFCTSDELLRFRQLLVNMVLATDFFDSELADQRNTRWQLAFNGDGDLHVRRFTDYRATVVLENIVQSADVAHCMQHWHVYQKWNHKLFDEMYMAYKAGRVERDPADYWYEGELDFFDRYVIPLAQKLIACDVSGVNGDEYLNYASLNRAEWEDRGREIVESFVKEASSTDASTVASTQGEE